jgi:hypothetical protein
MPQWTYSRCISKCHFSPDWGLDNGASSVLEVLAELSLEFGGGWKFTVGVAVYQYILEGNPRLPLVGDKGEYVLSERAENGISILLYEVYARVSCEGEGKVRRKGGPPVAHQDHDWGASFADGLPKAGFNGFNHGVCIAIERLLELNGSSAQ